MAGEKTRREKRKEARLVKQQNRFISWMQNQSVKKGHKKKNALMDLKPSSEMMEKKIKKEKSDSLKKGKSKTKFQEFLELDMGNGVLTGEEDLELEKRLSKKLKVKEGKLSGTDDGINFLIGESLSEPCSMFHDDTPMEDEVYKDDGRMERDFSSTKKCKRKKASDASTEQLDHEVYKTENGTSEKGKSKTKFQEFLELDMGNGVLTGEEDLELEKRLSKKLKVKEGKLSGTDDEINFLIGESLFETCSMFHDDTPMEDEVYKVDGRMDRDFSSTKKCKRKKASDASTEQLDHEVYKTENGTSEKVNTMKPVTIQKMRKKKSSPVVLGKQLEGEFIDMSGNAEKLELATEEPCTIKPSFIDNSGNAEKLDMATEAPSTFKPAVSSGVKYMPPQLRARLGIEFDELLEIHRKVKRLLNQLNESNVESITKDVAAIFQSLPRSDGCQIISQAFVESSTKNESFSAAFAAFVAGMACLVGIDFSAKLIAFFAQSFEDEYSKENGMFLKNLAKILCNLYIFGVCSSDLIYDLLSVLSQRLTELDVSIIDAILDHSGMKLRGDDPTAMKDFIFSIQNRVNELRSCSRGAHNGNRSISRMEFMLEKICDIKNNKIRPKEVPAYHTRLRKWLQKLRADDGILLRGLKWSKLLDPDKKGQWWISGDGTLSTNDVQEMTSTINKAITEAQKLVQLAAAQRMNTDIRRAIFCIIMSGEDYLDAFEKLLRLDLTGKQDREIMRVLVDCCLQEKVFNKYYTVLASKLCNHDKKNKFSLQYCLWDHFKELGSMEINRLMNLARFVAEMLCSFSVSLAILKTVDLTNPSDLTPKRIMHFRILIEAVFSNSDAVVWNIFTRIAAVPDLEMLRDSLVFFIKQYVVGVNKEEAAIAAKFKIAKKALNNVSGVLM